MTPKARKKALGLALRAAIGLGLLGLVLRMNRDQIRDVLDRRPDVSALVLGGASYLAGLMLSYFRWFLLVRAVGLPIRYRDAVRLGFIAAFFNFVIPGAIFGNVVKAAFLAREHPERRPTAIASVVVDFFCGLLGLFLIASAAGSIAATRLNPKLWTLGAFAGLASIATAAALIASFRGRRRKKVDLSAYRGHAGLVLGAVVLGMGTHSLNVLAFRDAGLAVLGSGVPDLVDHFLIVPLVLFTTAVPIPFGAIGISEQASSGLFGLLNYRGGTIAMLAFRLFTIVGATIGAIFYLLNARQVKELTNTPDSSITT